MALKSKVLRQKSIFWSRVALSLWALSIILYAIGGRVINTASAIIFGVGILPCLVMVIYDTKWKDALIKELWDYREEQSEKGVL